MNNWCDRLWSHLFLFLYGTNSLSNFTSQLYSDVDSSHEIEPAYIANEPSLTLTSLFTLIPIPTVQQFRSWECGTVWELALLSQRRNINWEQGSGMEDWGLPFSLWFVNINHETHLSTCRGTQKVFELSNCTSKGMNEHGEFLVFVRTAYHVWFGCLPGKVK